MHSIVTECPLSMFEDSSKLSSYSHPCRTLTWSNARAATEQRSWPCHGGVMAHICGTIKCPLPSANNAVDARRSLASSMPPLFKVAVNRSANPCQCICLISKLKTTESGPVPLWPAERGGAAYITNRSAPHASPRSDFRLISHSHLISHNLVGNYTLLLRSLYTGA